MRLIKLKTRRTYYCGFSASVNKKIINATPITASDGTQMKSVLEKSIYENLKKLGFSPRYEQETFVYWRGIRPTVPFYDMNKNRKLRYNMKKFISMKYKPDFVFDYDGIKVIIEAKGYENDQFPLRKKLFRTYLETLDYPIVYAEIFTIKQLKEFLAQLEKTKHRIKEKFNV